LDFSKDKRQIKSFSLRQQRSVKTVEVEALIEEASAASSTSDLIY
jgi:hypothetical protein